MELEKGIVVEVNDIKHAISVDKFANAVFIPSFDLELIEETLETISIPVIASCRIGHFIEAKILEKMGVSIIDESNPNKIEHLDKKGFSIPFMCKVDSIEEAKKRVEEGASFLRTEWGNVDDIAWLIKEVKEKINAKIFAALKKANPSDIAFLLQIGCYGVIVSSRLFYSPNPPKLLETIVEAAKHYNNIDEIARITKMASKVLIKEG